MCLCVCLCVHECADYTIQLLKDQSSASKSSIGFYSHVFLDLQKLIMLHSRVMPSFACLECHCSLFRRVRNKTCMFTARVLLL